MTKRFLTPIRLVNLDSDPGSALSGDMYFNTSSKTIRQYNGLLWNDVLDSTSGSGGDTDWNLFWQPSW
jgi:hypothetical protein